MPYVAAIVLCPIGAGAIIFLAVFFSKKQKKNKQKGDKDENTSKDNVPLTTPTVRLTTSNQATYSLIDRARTLLCLLWMEKFALMTINTVLSAVRC